VIILSKQFQLPETYDSGAEFFPALEHNIRQMNSHNHDGYNSEQLSAASSVAVVQDILAAGWVGLGNDVYRQLVTMPVLAAPLTLSFDTCQIALRTAAGEYLAATIARVSASSYYVYVNDPTLVLKAVYTS
jgi:hypothetical protein